MLKHPEKFGQHTGKENQLTLSTRRELTVQKIISNIRGNSILLQSA